MMQLKHLTVLATSVVIGFTVAPFALGDTEAELTVPAGTTATITAEMTIVSAACNGSDTDQATATVTGTAKVLLAPTQPPWNEVLIDPMHIQFSGMTFNFQFLNCIVDLFVTELEITPDFLLHAPIASDSVEFNDKMFLGWGSMSGTVAGVPLVPFHFGTKRPTTLSGRFTGDAATATFDNLSFGAFGGEVLPVLPDQLPPGIDSITFAITAHLSGVALTGPRIELEDLCDSQSTYTFRSCLTGPEGVLPGFCECLDADDDGHIDLRDFAEFQRSFAPSLALGADAKSGMTR